MALKSLHFGLSTLALSACMNQQAPRGEEAILYPRLTFNARLVPANEPPLPPARAIDGRWFLVPNHSSPSNQIFMVCHEELETPFYEYKHNSDGSIFVGDDGKYVIEGIAYERTAYYYLSSNETGKYHKMSEQLGECYWDVRGYGRAGAVWSAGDRFDNDDFGSSSPVYHEYEGAMVVMKHEYRKHSNLELIQGDFHEGEKLPYAFKSLGNFDEILGPKLFPGEKTIQDFATRVGLRMIAAEAQKLGYSLTPDTEIYSEMDWESLLEYRDYDPYVEALRKWIVEDEYSQEVADVSQLDIGETVDLVLSSYDSYGSTIHLQKDGKRFEASAEWNTRFVVGFSTDAATLDKTHLDYLVPVEGAKTYSIAIGNTPLTYYFNVMGQIAHASIDAESIQPAGN